MLRRCRSLSQTRARLFGRQTPTWSCAGRIVLTTKSYGTSRKVDPWKRDIGSRDPAGRIPFIPPNRSRYIEARYTSAQISESVTLGTGDLAGFPRASRATMRLANSFISIADWPGESIERSRSSGEREKKEEKKLSARPSAKVWTAICSPCMADLQIRTIALAQITRVISMNGKSRWVHPLIVYNNSSNARAKCEYILDYIVYSIIITLWVE